MYLDESHHYVFGRKYNRVAGRKRRLSYADTVLSVLLRCRVRSF